MGGSIEPEGVLDYQVPKRTLLAGLRSSPEGVLDTDAIRAAHGYLYYPILRLEALSAKS